MATTVLGYVSQSASLAPGPGKIGSSTTSEKPEEHPLFGFPAQLQSQLCWTPSSFSQSSEFVLQLNPDDLNALEAAISSFKS
jgi:hypothetical protein